MCHINPRCYGSVDDCGLASFQCMQGKNSLFGKYFEVGGKKSALQSGRQEVTFLHEPCYTWKIVSYNRDSTFTCDLLFIGIFFLFDSVNLCIQNNIQTK